MRNYLSDEETDINKLLDLIEYSSRGPFHFEEACQSNEIQSFLLWLQQIQNVMTDKNLLVWMKLNDVDKNDKINFEILGFGPNYDYIYLTYSGLEYYYYEIYRVFHDNKMVSSNLPYFYNPAYYLLLKNINSTLNPNSKSGFYTSTDDRFYSQPQISRYHNHFKF